MRGRRRRAITLGAKISNIVSGLKRRGASGSQLLHAREVLNGWWRNFGVCYLCYGKVDLAEIGLDHVQPLSRSGTHEYANLRPCHMRCNQIKGEFTLDEYRYLFSLNSPEYAKILSRRLYASGNMYRRHR